MPTGDNLPVVVDDRFPRHTRVERVGANDWEDSCGLDVVTYVTSGHDPTGPT